VDVYFIPLLLHTTAVPATDDETRHGVGLNSLVTRHTFSVMRGSFRVLSAPPRILVLTEISRFSATSPNWRHSSFTKPGGRHSVYVL
jgi:hypothetical protein